MGFAMDDLRSVDPAFAPANFAAAFGPAIAGMLWRGLHTETMCARRRSAPTGERRCSDSAAAARCNSEFSSENRRGTMLKRTTRTVAIIAALAILSAGAASAPELKVLSGGAMRAAVKELAGTFEASSGHKLVIEYGTVAKVAEKVVGDDPIDVAILTQPFLDQLVSTGKMIGATTAQLARVPIGVAVSQGTPKPDISSVEAFKRALLGAKLITYGDPGMGDAAGVHVARIVEALGLSGEAEDPSDFAATRAERGAIPEGLVPARRNGSCDGADQRSHRKPRWRDRRAASSRAAASQLGFLRRYTLDLPSTVRGKDPHRFLGRGASQVGL
jgi:ABC-type molybdate transport system substrate-binding protein